MTHAISALAVDACSASTEALQLQQKSQELTAISHTLRQLIEEFEQPHETAEE